MPANDDILTAVRLLREGRLVAFPTETVYGLGADATSPLAVGRIFAAKGRPSTNPLIVHVADAVVARRYTTAWPETAEQLARHFWPGPLTLVLPRADSIASNVTAGGSTVGLRVPNHPLALQLLQAFAGPVAAPSANRSNAISPTTAAAVRQELGDAVDLILDGGPAAVGIESTVIDLTRQPAVILRPGSVTQQQIESVIGPVDRFIGSVTAAVTAQSPGQHARHYSPRTAALWFRPGSGPVPADIRVAVMAITLPSPNRGPNLIQMPIDPADYARAFYQTLRELDSRSLSAIWIELPPDAPAWTGIRDRILRAATQAKDRR